MAGIISVAAPKYVIQEVKKILEPPLLKISSKGDPGIVASLLTGSSIKSSMRPTSLG